MQFLGTYSVIGRRVLAAWLVCTMTCLSLPAPVSASPTAPKAPPAPPRVNVRTGSRTPKMIDPKVHISTASDLEIQTARVFREALIPMSGPAEPGGNRALAAAILAYKAKDDSSNVSDFEKYIADYPGSRWNASIELNLGRNKFERGYLSDALKYWLDSWNRSKNEKAASQKAIANRAVSELVILNGRLGQTNELRRLLKEIGKRSFFGSDELNVETARSGLRVMDENPGIAFKCGPFALEAMDPALTGNATILKYASSSRGTNLLELKQLADKLGLHLQMAKRAPGAAIVVPSVMHWKIGHFAAIVGRDQRGYRLKDKTFDADGLMSITQQAMDDQSDGYFLVQEGKLPENWTAVSDVDAANVWGKGFVPGLRDEGKPPSSPKDSGCDSCCGMAVASAFSMNATLNIVDVPMSYSPPVGPKIDMLVNYNYLESNQPATYTFTNFGQNWTLNWISYLTLDASSNATVRVRNGGSEVYNYALSDNVTNPYAPNIISQAVLTVMSPGVYQRQMPDGSIEVFNQPDGTGRIFMTQLLDPQGNAVSIQYDANFRITSVTDAISQATTFSYVSNTLGNAGFYQISQISDPFSRTASFTYDSTNTILISNTDVIGITSKYLSDSSTSLITALTTPYGTTSFYQYTGTGPTPSRGIRFTFPDGSSSVLENWIPNTTTYYWDREATALYPSDPANQVYTHCRTYVWNGGNAQYEFPILSTDTKALEATKTYTYAQAYGHLTTSNKPLQTSMEIAENPQATLTLTGTLTTGHTVAVRVYGDNAYPAESVSYVIQAGDTLNSLAATLAQKINQDTILQSWRVSASNAPGTPVIFLQCHAPFYRQYAYDTSGETGVVALNYYRTENATIGGTVTTGNVLSLNIYDIGLPGGVQTVSYTVVGGDTLATIATALKNGVNNNANLKQARISAVPAPAGFVSVVSSSINPTSYSSSTSGGATETIALATNANTVVHAGLDMTSTVTVGSTYTLTVTDAGIPGGAKNISYTVQTGDTRGTAIAALAAQINSDTDLKAIGVTCTAGPINYFYLAPAMVCFLYSRSVNATTYSSPGSPFFVQNDFSFDRIQTWSYNWNAQGKATQITDPAKRVFSFRYAANGIDLLEKRESQSGDNLLLGKWEFNNDKHLPNLYIDASGQQTQYTYNSFGEIQTITDANSNVTTFSYNANGYLTQIDGPLAGTNDVTTFTYDGYGRLYTVTDSEGYVITYSYDSANRTTVTTYPDGTTEQTIYEKLDVSMSKDRIGRWTQSGYDSMDQLAYQVDALGRKTQYAWCVCGSLASMTDPAGHTTSWAHDLEGRVTQKTYPDGTRTNYVWDNSLSRIAQRVDALQQVTNYLYLQDNTLAQIAHPYSVNATSNAAYMSDPTFNRSLGISNGAVGNVYRYNPYISDAFATPTTGVGRLASVSNNTIANATTTYSYDSLGRTSNRSINGATNSDTSSYDAMSRITGETNTLGSFTYSYFDDVPGSSKGTNRLSQIGYPNSQKTNFSWYPNVGDQRLQRISNVTSTGALLSEFNYSYDPAGQITQWPQIQNNASQFYNLGYDRAGQLTKAQSGSGAPPSSAFLNQNYYAYDVASNRTAVQKTAVQKATIGGTITIGNTVTVTVADPALSGGSEAVVYTIVSGDTTTTVATKLAAAITADAKLQAIGVNAVSSGTTVSLKSGSPNITTYTKAVTGTIIMTLGVTSNFTELASVGGTKTTGDIMTITVYDPALAGGKEIVNYTVLVGDTLTTIATGIKAAINADSNLSTKGITATSAGQVVAIKSASVNATTYVQSTNAGATETITLAVAPNGATTLGVGGTITVGNVLTVVVYDSGLVGGSKTVNYTVVAGDTTLALLATHLAAAIAADTGLVAQGISATASGTVVTLASNSPNVTTYRQAVNSAATETLAMGLPANGTETLTVGGTPRTSDVISLGFFDAGLAGGSKTDTYTVLAAATPTTIATALAALINADSTLTTAGITATSSSAVVNIKSVSQNATTYTAVVTTAGGTESLTLAPATSATAYGYNAVNELTNMGPGGAVLFQIGTNKPVKSAVVGTPVVSVTSASTNATTYTTSVTGTETISLGNNLGGSQTATIAGTITTGNTLTVTVHDTALPGGIEAVTYTVVGGDTLISIAAGLAAAMNVDTKLQAIGVSASASPSMQAAWSQSWFGNAGTSPGMNAETVSATDGGSNTVSSLYKLPAAGTTYTQSVTGTETITFTSTNSGNGNTTANIGGSKTTGDVVNMTVYNSALSGGQETASYTVLAGDTLTTIATGLKNAINADVKLQAIGLSATSATTVITMSVASGTGRTLAYDLNGNMTSDGTNTYAWDAENRLIQITYPGTNNYSSFTYDGMNRNVKIVETVAGSVTSTKQFVWCGGSKPSEARDGTSAITAQYFGRGQTIGGTTNKYCYTLDHLGSVREVTDSSGTIQAQYGYDPYGQITNVQGTTDSDFGYARLYRHQASGLNLAAARAYSASLGRFLNRDPIEESGGSNLYAYAANNAISLTDPSGLQCVNDDDPIGGTAVPSYPVWGKSFKGPFQLSQINIMYAGVGLGNNVFGPGLNNLRDPSFLLTAAYAAQLIFSGGAAAPLVAEEAVAINTGKVAVYTATAGTETIYVGITNSIVRRAAEHAARFSIQGIKGLGNLSRADARAVEQTLINRYGLSGSGGSLQNIINSISPNNEKYAQALQRGAQLLKEAGYPGF